MRVERVTRRRHARIIVSPFVLPADSLVLRTAAVDRRLMRNGVAMRSAGRWPTDMDAVVAVLRRVS